eukprot:3645811-Ditylum_brightwellii.AAC.1
MMQGNQKGLDWHHELLEREKLERKELKEQYKNNPQDQSSHFNFLKLQKKTKGSRKKYNTNDIPDAQDVFVGINEDDLNLLGEEIESGGEKEEKQIIKVV